MSVTTIHRLERSVAERIAAGEVIERPAAVVKELVENALDAGARTIEIDIEDGGIFGIRVADDGTGMSRDDLALSIERHATSKLTQIDDLTRLKTFGFRGEALPSIAAISALEIVTRRQGEDGFRLTVIGGEHPAVLTAPAANGTVVQVSDLFFNVPARKKFLKTARGEAARVRQLVGQLALAYPACAFLLRHGGHVWLKTSRHADLQTRMHEIIGENCKLFPFDRAADRILIEGYATRPPDVKASASNIFLFVNRRPIQDRALQHAIIDAYGDHLMRRQYPSVVAMIDIDPAEIDVNVHPTKSEIRFSRPSQVYQLLRDAIREMLVGGVTRLERVSHHDPPLSLVMVANHSIGRPVDGTLFPLPQIEHQPVRESAATAAPATWNEEVASEQLDFRHCRPLGQIGQSYLVAESPHGDLVLIDQHAAHERIRYEMLRRQLAAGRVTSQVLLIPIVLEVSIEQAERIEAHAETFAQIGLDIQRFGASDIRVSAMPGWMGSDRLGALLLALVAAIEGAGVEMPMNELLKTMACHSSVRARDKLALDEISALFEQMSVTPNFDHCPHGRPTLRLIDARELSSWFNRR